MKRSGGSGSSRIKFQGINKYPIPSTVKWFFFFFHGDPLHKDSMRPYESSITLVECLPLTCLICIAVIIYAVHSMLAIFSITIVGCDVPTSPPPLPSQALLCAAKTNETPICNALGSWLVHVAIFVVLCERCR